MTNTQNLVKGRIDGMITNFDLYNRTGSAEANPFSCHVRFKLASMSFVLVINGTECDKGTDWKKLCDTADAAYAMGAADLDAYLTPFKAK